MSTNERTCICCGCTGEDMVETREGFVCRDCLDTNFFTCPDCGDVVRIEDEVVINPYRFNERNVCPDCAATRYMCEECGERFDYRHINSDRYGRIICDDCFNREDYARCDRCGRILPSDDLTWHDSRDAYLCEDCESEIRRSSCFHDYGYKPAPEFKFRSSETRSEPGAMPSVLTFGVELEVDEGDDHLDLSAALAALGLPIYMKHDGSLGEEGVEIVTHPCSLAYHQYELRWSEISRICRQHGYNSHEPGTCGLHIHVGRSQMGDTWEAKRTTAGNLVLLAEALWYKLVNFSRRNESQLDDWANRPGLDLIEDAEYTDDELRTVALHTRHNGRYQAVNLCNDDTVEFRIFRGTLRRDSIIAAIQLVSNLTKYAMTHTPKECFRATWADVIGVEQFKELNSYCESRGL